MDDLMRAGVVKLFNNPKLSDLTIRCGSRSWPVHKVVLCSQSDYFGRMLQSGFKEGHEGVIELREDDPEIVHLVLEWFYSSISIFFRSVEENSTTLSSNPELLVRVYELADKYLLSSLKTDVGTYFGHSIFKGNLEYTAGAIDLLYDMEASISAPLRDILENTIWTRRKTLCANDDKVAGFFRQLLRTAPRDFVALMTIRFGRNY